MVLNGGQLADCWGYFLNEPTMQKTAEGNKVRICLRLGAVFVPKLSLPTQNGTRILCSICVAERICAWKGYTGRLLLHLSTRWAKRVSHIGLTILLNFDGIVGHFFIPFMV